jgi:hypothetical protein
MALSRNVYTSALLTARHNFTQKGSFCCGNITGYNQRYLGLYIKFQIFCLSILTKFGFSRQILIKVPSTKFDGNAFSESRIDTSGQTD